MADELDQPALRTRVVRSAGWALAGRAVLRGLLLVKLVIMARLLDPEDFGLFGFAMLTLGALSTFTRTGFNSALIQRKDNARDYLDTAWTAHAIRAVLLGAAMVGTAPLVAAFFDDERIVPLVRVLSGTAVLLGFTNIGVIYFRKELDFRRQFALDLARGGTSFVVGVGLAFVLRSVWALIYAHVAATGVLCLASYAMHGYRPRLRLDRAQIAELFRFGRWVLGASVVAFLTMHGDDLLLGKLLGAAALGAYQIAYQVSNAPAAEIARLCNTVMMPTYAKVQHQPARLRATFLEVFELVASAAVPLVAFTLFAAPELVVGLLGAKWEAAIAPVQVLSVAALLRVLTATGSPAAIGTGRPHMHFWMNVARLSVIVPTVYPLTRALGVTGTALSVTLGMAAAVPLWVRILPVLHVRSRGMLNAAAAPLCLGVLAALGVLSSRLLPAEHALLRLAADLVAGGWLCTLAAWWMARRYGRGPFVQARKMLSDLRGARPAP